MFLPDDPSPLSSSIHLLDVTLPCVLYFRLNHFKRLASMVPQALLLLNDKAKQAGTRIKDRAAQIIGLKQHELCISENVRFRIGGCHT